jgi:hypothetical protein
VLEEAARTIGDAAHAVGATLDAPDDEGRLLDACEAIVTARARLHELRDAPVRSRELMGPDPERCRLTAIQLLAQIGGRPRSG